MVERICLSGVVIIVGNYGSGKTEIAVNLAVHQKRRGINVRVADLDLVNPYFRTREARAVLAAKGIDVVLPPERLLQADLPILIPQVAGLIKAPGDLAILDVGGDDAGATVLAALHHVLAQLEGKMTMIQVVNPFRPNTGSVEGCLKMRGIIESSARLSINRWACNAHMLDETTLDHLRFGNQFMESLQKASGLKVEFVTAPHDLVRQIEAGQSSWPVLPIYRQLVPPWKKAVGFATGMDRKE